MFHDLPDTVFIQDGVPVSLVRPGRPLLSFHRKPERRREVQTPSPAPRPRRLGIRTAS